MRTNLTYLLKFASFVPELSPFILLGMGLDVMFILVKVKCMMFQDSL